MARAGGTEAVYLVGKDDIVGDFTDALQSIRRSVPCSYGIPESTSSRAIDPTFLNLTMKLGDGDDVVIPQTASRNACGDEDAWYDVRKNQEATPTRISLCPVPAAERAPWLSDVAPRIPKAPQGSTPSESAWPSQRGSFVDSTPASCAREPCPTASCSGIRAWYPHGTTSPITWSHAPKRRGRANPCATWRQSPSGMDLWFPADSPRSLSCGQQTRSLAGSLTRSHAGHCRECLSGGWFGVATSVHPAYHTTACGCLRCPPTLPPMPTGTRFF